MKELAHNTRTGTAEIDTAPENITAGFTRLADETDQTATTSKWLRKTPTRLPPRSGRSAKRCSGSTRHIDECVGEVGVPCGEFTIIFDKMASSLSESSDALTEATQEMDTVALDTKSLARRVACNY